MTQNNSGIYLGSTPLLNSGGGQQDSIYNYLANPVELSEYVNTNNLDIDMLMSTLNGDKLIYGDILWRNNYMLRRFKGYFPIYNRTNSNADIPYSSNLPILQRNNTTNQIYLIEPLSYISSNNLHYTRQAKLFEILSEQNNNYYMEYNMAENNNPKWGLVAGKLYIGDIPNLTELDSENISDSQ